MAPSDGIALCLFNCGGGDVGGGGFFLSCSLPVQYLFRVSKTPLCLRLCVKELMR